MIDLDAIQARADAATAGPWEAMVPVEEDGYVDWWVWQTAALPYYGGVLHVQGHEDDTRRGEIGSADITDGGDKERERLDAEFIAHAREDVPALIAELLEARAQRDDAVKAAAEALMMLSDWARGADTFTTDDAFRVCRGLRAALEAAS